MELPFTLVEYPQNSNELYMYNATESDPLN